MPTRSWFWLALPLALACTGCSSCSAPDPSAVVVEGKTENGLLAISKATDTARVGVLRGAGTSVFFGNDFIPRSSSSIPMSCRVWVARNAIKLTFTDRDGKEQSVLAAPGAPGQWSGTVRLLRPKEGNNGFHVQLVPTEGSPAQAEGVVLEVVYTAS